ALSGDRAQQLPGAVVGAELPGSGDGHPNVPARVEGDVRLRIDLALPPRHRKSPDELAVAREDLDAAVAVVAHVHLAAVDRHPARLEELPGLRAPASPLLLLLAVRRVAQQAPVARVGQEDRPALVHRDAAWPKEGSLPFADVSAVLREHLHAL